MKIKIKKLTADAIIPRHETPGAAGVDLYVTDYVEKNYYTEYHTGLAVEIPEGYVGLLFPRSSISKQPGALLANSVGVIDSDYRGEIRCRFRNAKYLIGERMAQLVVVPYSQIEFEEVFDLSETDRGEGGFGSTS